MKAARAFARSLRAERERQGLSMLRLSVASGVSISVINRAENQPDGSLTMRSAQLLADGLGRELRSML